MLVVALVLCLVELDLLNTPVDSLLQRGSAVFGIVATLVWSAWKWLVSLRMFLFPRYVKNGSFS